MKKLLLTSVLILSMIALAACGSNDDADAEGSSSKLDELKEAGKVTVGFADEKPYAYEEDGELKGAAVDIAKAVFKELGIEEVEGHLSEFDSLVSGLNAGKFDAITAGMAIMPKRCENVAFGEPEMKYGEGLIVEKGNPLNLKSYKDIAENPDVSVAIMAGATENDYVQTEGVDEGQIQSVPDIPASFSAVSSGRADATTGTEMTVKMALESADNDNLEFVEDFEQPNIEGVPSYGAAAFQQDHTDLLEAYNEKLKELKEDGTVGELLEDNYFSAEGNSVDPSITTESVCSGEVYED
ncbi:putative amino-acid ABC transporter periplasmic-binding protein [Lentibacillus sp. JNUCC-1]|uniref:ectoine/hydroxyectoine ABC transporter substrate-binding protein EhuB n=1 Tax=Lentibacillus sp. JNUCC-1 TaxID=2654513 RepID=UPI0012E729BA|nr:ectoine/hydroxyectoine ABC transporter substrate-binding protein EhuB [Lentibacillus sp. JNUCC-1]MUV38443.1 putative amino-acid ABC transporter periplasmic-binding protein [Lentibacillus sp. JNUCC-1]